jgi:arginine repressor
MRDEKRSMLIAANRMTCVMVPTKPGEASVAARVVDAYT